MPADKIETYSAEQVDRYLTDVRVEVRQLQSEVALLQAGSSRKDPPTLSENETGFRLAFQAPADAKAEELSQILTDAISLVRLSVLLTNADPQGDNPFTDPELLDPKLHASIETSVLSKILATLSVRQLSYGSPVEIFAVITGGSGAAYYAATRAFAIYRKYQDARVYKSEADKRVAANDLVTRSINEVPLTLRSAIESAVASEIEGAVRALVRLERAEIARPGGDMAGASS